MSLVNIFFKPDASPELQAERLSKCLTCPSLRKYKKLNGDTGNSCGKYVIDMLLLEKETCGCDVNDKVGYTIEKCPQGKWKQNSI